MMDVELPVKPVRTKVVLRLHEPEKGTECPILQETIHEAVLDWMPRPYDVEHPTYKAVTTACGHTFHGLALIYHWARNRNLLCPVCRAGPKGAHLVMSRLPKEWRYSLSARVRRERQKDKQEKEETDRAVAHSLAERPSMIFSFKIRLESNFNTAWLVSTVPVAVMDYVIFDVPSFELALIPFARDTRVRMLALLYTSTGVTTLYPPSEWFLGGEEPGNNFSVHRDDRGFHHIHFRMHDHQFAQMIQFALTG